MTNLPKLECGAYRLRLDPTCGGSIHDFDWNGIPLLRPSCGEGILSRACWPLVPFSNRIARGRFQAGEFLVELPPNKPDIDPVHPIHGYGWLAPWIVTSCNDSRITLTHDYQPGDWPWKYNATQILHLTEDGLTITLSVTNCDTRPMPAGLGFHPYFPRNSVARITGYHCGEWQNTDDCIPLELMSANKPIDWWEGAPVETRAVDTVYVGRDGPLIVSWPDRLTSLTLTPSDNLPFTAIFVPDDEPFFCAEPVSHMTNAVNHPSPESGIVWLKPGESLSAALGMSGSTTAKDGSQSAA